MDPLQKRLKAILIEIKAIGDLWDKEIEKYGAEGTIMTSFPKREAYRKRSHSLIKERDEILAKLTDETE